MSLRYLGQFFAPKSVALIGASTRAGSVGHTVLANMMGSGFAGAIWPVNPKYRQIADLHCYPSVNALPAAPDLAVLMTPPATIPDLAADLVAKGTKAAIVITGGLDQPATERMLANARAGGLRLVGPNCLGVLAPPVGLNASFSEGAPLLGNLLVGQLTVLT